MSQEDLIKQNQRTFKQSFNRNYRIYKEIMNMVKVDLNLIDIEEQIIKNFLDSQQRFEKKAMDLKNEIACFLEKWKNKKVVELGNEDLKGYSTFAKVQNQLNEIYKVKEAKLSKTEENVLMQKYEYLQSVLSDFTVLQLNKFQKYYDYVNETVALNAELAEMSERLDYAQETIQGYKKEIAQSTLLNKMRKEEVTKEKNDRLNKYIEKLRKNFNKFTPINKMIYSKKIKRVETDENRMTF